MNELFIRCRKLNISLLFITHHILEFQKSSRLSKRKLRQIALTSDIDSKDFVKIYKKCTAEPYSFLVSDAMLNSENPLNLEKNLS